MGDQHKQATNEPSFLLSDEENEMVFAALGAQRIVSHCSLPLSEPILLLDLQTKATAVAQVYHAHPDPSRWTKYKTGVVCLVKDNLRKSYYIRLLEMNVSTILHWIYIVVYVGQKIFNSMGAGVIQPVHLQKGFSSISSFSWRCK